MTAALSVPSPLPRPSACSNELFVPGKKIHLPTGFPLFFWDCGLIISWECPRHTLLIPSRTMPGLLGPCNRPNPAPSFWIVEPEGDVVTYRATTPGDRP